MFWLYLEKDFIILHPWWNQLLISLFIFVFYLNCSIFLFRKFYFKNANKILILSKILWKYDWDCSQSSTLSIQIVKWACFLKRVLSEVIGSIFCMLYELVPPLKLLCLHIFCSLLNGLCWPVQLSATFPWSRFLWYMRFISRSSEREKRKRSAFVFPSLLLRALGAKA